MARELWVDLCIGGAVRVIKPVRTRFQRGSQNESRFGSRNEIEYGHNYDHDPN